MRLSISLDNAATTGYGGGMLLPMPEPPYVLYDSLKPEQFALQGWTAEGTTLRSAVFRKGLAEVRYDKAKGWCWAGCGLDGFMNPDMAMRAYDARHKGEIA